MKLIEIFYEKLIYEKKKESDKNQMKKLDKIPIIRWIAKKITKIQLTDKTLKIRALS